jgi:serine/threonine-protein kinase
VDRFAPGTLVAGRYRIVAFVGRGGMGEVYRAHDIRVDQPVALKFLPARLESKPEALARFIAELRLGRQVSHPNVCRLYDIGEHEGHQFITMEYVDGEDLASLLLRIGRLPSEKIVQIARDIAAGLAAAHAIGIVHGDLKPSNVMIDGKGRGRISDFGLAIAGNEEAIEQILEDLPAYWMGRSDGAVVGTPAYMAPEQLAGEGTTPRSDVYAFGLILYECVTGQPFHGTGSAGDVIRRRLSENGTSQSNASLEDVDPAFGRLLRHCLDADPRRRPASGQSVLAALPGADPLATAVAAGETPSPELVAAAGERGELSPVAAGSLLATMVVASIAFAALFQKTFLHANIEGIRSPRELTERAAGIATLFSDAPQRDASSWFHWDIAYVDALPSNVKRNVEWRRILNQRPTPARFTYRESPRPMVAGGWRDNAITANDPPLTVPGMSRVTLDPHGRLRELVVVPPEHMSGSAKTDWQRLFALAELPAAAFHPVAPEWSPPIGSDERHAWMGVTPGSNSPLRVEAAARAGRPVWFSLIEPTRSTMTAAGMDGGWTMTAALRGIVPLVTLILAFFNIRRGRGDRHGALRLALVVFAAALLGRLVRAHHSPDAFAEITVVQSTIGAALFTGIASAVAYLGLEPYIRRYDPEALISWVRLVNGRLRDPLVGRHMLIGLTVGTVGMTVWCFFFLAQPLFGLRAGRPIVSTLSTLSGPGHALFWMLRRFEAGLTDGIHAAFLLVVFRAVVRKPWASYVMLYAAFVVILMRVPGDLPITRLIYAAWFAGVVLWVLRFAGVLGVTALAVAANVIPILPLTLDPNAFHAGRSMFGLFVLIGGATLAMIVSIGRKPAFA